MFVSKKLSCILTAIALLLYAGTMWAQDLKVTGTVVDKSGQPIVGAYVLVDGTNNGTTTDLDGHYAITAPSKGTLAFTCMGYEDAKVAVNGRSVVNIALADDAILLSDAVVVGYGTQKKANLTGSVATVDVGKTLESKPVASLGKALQGAVPGLTVINTSGNIDDEPTITIRGIGTLSNDGTSKPLYIVDGVPIDNISYLNTQDIESISVLKDAASSSIYGTRAAFGVVIITTKASAKGEKAVINYSNNFGWSQPTSLPNYDTVVNQMYAFIDVNKNINADAELFGMYFDTPEYQQAAINWQKKHGGKSGYRAMVEGDDYIMNDSGTASYVADWDVVGIMYNKATPSQNHTLSVQGGTDKTTYYMSVGYDHEQGILNFNPDKINKYNATVNVSSQVTKWLKVGARINYMDKVYSYPYLRQSNYVYMWRWGSMFGPWGYFQDGTDARNLIAYRKQGGDSYDKTRNLRLGGFATANITKNLTLNADYTYLFNNTQYKGVGVPVNVYNTWGDIREISALSTTSFVETSRSFTEGYNANIYGNYTLDLGKNHHLNFMAGFNVDESDYQYLYYENHDIQDYNMPELALTPTFYSYSHSHSQTGSAGFFGRINYNYADKFLLELNGRYDGSSKFPANSRWAFFPSASAGYRLSQEDYWEPIKPYVNNAKLRVSYGEIGNQEVGSNMFLETMSKQSNAVNWIGSGSSKYSYFSMPKLVSSSLTWETIATTNVGLDLGFLNGDLNVTFDWFQRDTKNMLAPGSVLPQVLGASAAYENAGSLRSRGWEINVDWHHTFGDINVYAIGNLSDYKTVITSWDNDSPQLNTKYTGKEYGAIWGFETAGYFANAADVANSADQSKLQSGSFKYGVGDVKFVDQNGDKVIDWGKGTEEDHGDLIKIGNTTPRYQYSLRFGGSWKGFDVDLYLQGVGKRNIWTVSQFVIPYSRGADAIYASQMDYITNEEVASEKIRQDASQPRLYAGSGSQGTISSNIIGTGRYNFYPQSRFLLNMAYLRMKNITVGYSLPKTVTDAIRIQKVRVYATINNAFDIINHNRNLGIDPEINQGSNYDWGRVDPLMRTFSCGLQVTF